MNPMNQTAEFDPSAPIYPTQQAYLAVEQKPRDEHENRLIEQVRQYVQAHSYQADLRELAPIVQLLLGTTYQVGSGGAHVWIVRRPEEGKQRPAERLAIVADQLTTAYRDWFATETLTSNAPTP